MIKGVRGSPRASDAGELGALRTAACDAGWSQSCAVFGLPYDLSVFLFHQYHFQKKKVLTDAHTCATLPCVAFCACGSGSLSAEVEGGQISAHGAGTNSGTTIPRSLKIFSRSLVAL